MRYIGRQARRGKAPFLMHDGGRHTCRRHASAVFDKTDFWELGSSPQRRERVFHIVGFRHGANLGSEEGGVDLEVKLQVASPFRRTGIREAGCVWLLSMLISRIPTLGQELDYFNIYTPGGP